MYRQVAAVREALVALGAFVGSLAVVGAHVNEQVALVPELLEANLALALALLAAFAVVAARVAWPTWSTARLAGRCFHLLLLNHHLLIRQIWYHIVGVAGYRGMCGLLLQIGIIFYCFLIDNKTQ